jgi:hypothetical protein
MFVKFSQPKEGMKVAFKKWNTDSRMQKIMTLNFNVPLELEIKEGTEHELDKEQFVQKTEQLTPEHGHQSFYAI